MGGPEPAGEDSSGSIENLQSLFITEEQDVTRLECRLNLYSYNDCKMTTEPYSLAASSKQDCSQAPQWAPKERVETDTLPLDRATRNRLLKAAKKLGVKVENVEPHSQDTRKSPTSIWDQRQDEVGMLTVLQSPSEMEAESEDAENIAPGQTLITMPEDLSGARLFPPSLEEIEDVWGPLEESGWRDPSSFLVPKGKRYGTRRSRQKKNEKVVRFDSRPPTVIPHDHSFAAAEIDLSPEEEPTMEDGWPARTYDGNPIPMIQDTNSGDSYNREKQIFGRNCIGFPTKRRVEDHCRPLAQDSQAAIDEWISAMHPDFAKSGMATVNEVARIHQLLYTWRDLFKESI